MKRIIQTLISGLLLFVATFFAIGWPLAMLLWIFVLGDSYENIWRILPLVFGIISACITIAFVWLDLANKTTKRNRFVRLVFSVSVCMIVAAMEIRDEVSRIKGWSSDEAALSVASSLYPELKSSMVLHEESKSNVPSFGRGPNIVYIVISDTEPVCRVAVCRRYWSWWTCGMYETLKERGRKTQSTH